MTTFLPKYNMHMRKPLLLEFIGMGSGNHLPENHFNTQITDYLPSHMTTFLPKYNMDMRKPLLLEFIGMGSGNHLPKNHFNTQITDYLPTQI